MHLSSEQVRAARALLRWDQRELAEKSGVPVSTVKRLEIKPGPLAAHGRTIAAMQGAIEAAGIIFMAHGDTTDGGEGVRLRSGVRAAP